jgi:hypothetical protein
MTSMPARAALRASMRRQGSTAAFSSETSLPSAAPKPPGLEEVALHVDDHECRPADVDLKRIRFGLDPDWHSIAPRSPAGGATQVRGQVPAIVCKRFAAFAAG